MRPSRNPPAGYVRAASVTLQGNRRLLMWLNVASLPALVIAGYGFAGLASLVRPRLIDDLGFSLSSSSPAPPSFVFVLFGLLLMPFVIVVLHEAVHGLAFWFYTKARPEFGFKGWYAYAAAPGWYLGRHQYLVVGLAPLVGISMVALALVAVLPAPLAAVVLLGSVLNAASATGDLYLCARIMTWPASTVIEDRGNGVTWWVPTAPRVPAQRVQGKPGLVDRNESL